VIYPAASHQQKFFCGETVLCRPPASGLSSIKACHMFPVQSYYTTAQTDVSEDCPPPEEMMVKRRSSFLGQVHSLKDDYGAAAQNEVCEVSKYLPGLMREEAGAYKRG
jgi:hypothetical protein